MFLQYHPTIALETLSSIQAPRYYHGFYDGEK